MQKGIDSNKDRVCGDKIKHESRGSAQTHKHALMSRGQTQHKINIYRCPVCKFYHVGRDYYKKQKKGQ